MRGMTGETKHQAGQYAQTFRYIDDILWKEAGGTTELDHTEQRFIIDTHLMGIQ